ncbi:MAG: TetR/AcrR family transcriptional regulator [Hyphomicrobiaceae bacterium]|nr:TetR/AcrR family transcriptional regulator [Hyphomicrobiaceae bacterium]
MGYQNEAMNTRDRLIGAMIDLVRQKGYDAVRVEDVCAAAGVSKGAFFHYFKSKQEIAEIAADTWRDNSCGLFASMGFVQGDDRDASARDKLLRYVDFRISLIEGSKEIYEFCCYAGTLVQEVHATHPDLNDRAAAGIINHVAQLEPICVEALADAGRDVAEAPALARYFQTVMQGALLMAKAYRTPDAAIFSLRQFKTHLALLFDGSRPKPEEPSP